MSASSPFADRERAAKEATARAEAEEQIRLFDLLATPAGRWILGEIVKVFEREIHSPPEGHNSLSSYRRGRQDLACEWRDKIKKHFGHSALDKLEEKT